MDASEELLAKLLKPEVHEPDPKLDRLAHQVIGAAIEVHRQLGPGFLESIYEEAMCIELALRGIAFTRQPAISIGYKGRPVGQGNWIFWLEAALSWN